jgi:hypothetical protein
MTHTNQDIAPLAKKTTVAGIFLIIALIALLGAEAYFGYTVSVLSHQQERIKEDYSVEHSITFGVFSVDKWREKIVTVMDGKVSDFKMTAQQKRALQKSVEAQLNGLIDKTFADINKPQKGLGGKLKKFAFNTFVDPAEIKAQVPAFAKTIITTVNSPASRKRLKSIASSKIDQLEKETYDNSQVASSTVTSHIYRKYKVNNALAFEKTIISQLSNIRTQTFDYAYAMLGCVLLALVLWLLFRKQIQLHTPVFMLALLFALVLLLVGVTATIIEVDARMQTLNFTLLGEKLAFDNQVLFFQSKSIMGIIQSLVDQPKPDAILVGGLIFLFVIVMPILRMIGKAIYIWGSERSKDNKVVRYIALELGKWDMADVMVVGIGMTYIGLNGILQSQLSNLNIKEELLSTVTQNNTSLQPGYFIFVGYVVYAGILSLILKKIIAK